MFSAMHSVVHCAALQITEMIAHIPLFDWEA